MRLFETTVIVNRREYRAMCAGRYPKAQWYSFNHSARLALHNARKWKLYIASGERAILRIPLLDL